MFTIIVTVIVETDESSVLIFNINIVLAKVKDSITVLPKLVLKENECLYICLRQKMTLLIDSNFLSLSLSTYEILCPSRKTLDHQADRSLMW